MVYDLVTKHIPFQGADSVVTAMPELGIVEKKYINLVNTLKQVGGDQCLPHDEACAKADEIIQQYNEDMQTLAHHLHANTASVTNQSVQLKGDTYTLHAELIRPGSEVLIDDDGVPVVTGQALIDADIYDPYEGYKVLGLDIQDYSQSGISRALQTFISKAFDSINPDGKYKLDFSNVRIKVDKATKKINFYITDLAESLYRSYIMQKD